MTKIKIKELEEDDLFRGFIRSLDSLRSTGTLQKEKAEEIFQKIQQNPNHHIFVFIHDGGLVGHIEDVVVSEENQGRGIGEKLVQHALSFAKKSGCYKTILDCDDELIPFYERSGFKKHSTEMRFDHD